MRRIALCIQYDGTNYKGWQKQLELNTVQFTLEGAISQLDPRGPCKVFAAGRTDSGVHAAAQIVHFDCVCPIPVKSWPSALNGRLPNSIKVRDAVLRPSKWHACYSAIYRRYRYTIFNARSPNLFLEPWTWHRYQKKLDHLKMEEALKSLLGSYLLAFSLNSIPLTLSPR